MGLNALMGDVTARLRNKFFGTKITDKNGELRDTAVQQAVEEIIAALGNTAPITLQGPLRLVNPSPNQPAIQIFDQGGSGAAIHTYNNAGDASVVSIGGFSVTNGSTGQTQIVPTPTFPPLGGNGSPNISIGPTIGGTTFTGMTLSPPCTTVGGVNISGVSVGGAGQGFNANPTTGTSIPNGGGYNPITIIGGAGGSINEGSYSGVPGGNMQPAFGTNPNAVVNGNGPGSIGGPAGVTYTNSSGDTTFVSNDVNGGSTNQTGVTIVNPGGSGGGGNITIINVLDENNEYGDLSNPCDGTPLRPFKLNATLVEGGAAARATGQYYDLTTGGFVDTDVVVLLSTRYWRGRAETDDLVLAVWDCVSQTFYAVGSGSKFDKVVELSAAAFEGNGAAVTCTVQSWSGTQWVDSAETLSVYTDYFGGYGFANELYLAKYSPPADRWYLVGSGHYMTRGTLAGSLASGGTASVTLARGGTVTCYEVLGLTSSIASGKKVMLHWNHDTDHWEVGAAQCA